MLRVVLEISEGKIVAASSDLTGVELVVIDYSQEGRVFEGRSCAIAPVEVVLDTRKAEAAGRMIRN